MSNALKLLFKSPAFYSALLAVISAIVMYYAAVPKEIWIPVEALLAAIFAIFVGDGAAKAMGDRVIIGLREFRNEDQEAMRSDLYSNKRVEWKG